MTDVVAIGGRVSSKNFIDTGAQTPRPALGGGIIELSASFHPKRNLKCSFEIVI
jgi:hypothetical protein